MTILSKNDQRGRSMVEMLGVLAIIGVLSVGGISGYSKAMAKFKLTKAQDQISMLLMNIRTAFATSPSYDGLSNATAVVFGIAPSEMYDAKKISTLTGNASALNGSKIGALSNAFGGQAHVNSCSGSDALAGALGCSGGNYVSTNKAQYFAITMTGLAREACVSLLSSDWGSDGLVSIIVKPTKGSGAGATFAPSDLPVSMYQASSACGGYGAISSIAWTYY